MIPGVLCGVFSGGRIDNKVKATGQMKNDEESTLMNVFHLVPTRKVSNTEACNDM